MIASNKMKTRLICAYFSIWSVNFSVLVENFFVDKDSFVIIIHKLDYVTKMEEMIKNGIQKGVYVETEDNTLRDLKCFQNFLYRNLIMNIATKCIHLRTNQPNSIGLQKHINLKILIKSTYNV